MADVGIGPRSSSSCSEGDTFRCVSWCSSFKISSSSSTRWCGVVVRRGEVPAQVSSTSLDHGSKLRGPSPKALVSLNSATLIFNQSINRVLLSSVHLHVPL
ncbi:hypothetical protein TNCV_3013851 [Trichonephila clavipes]|nr:hypothetical protein TNCV_3013851 [Trichonephila clavipes]